MANIVIKELYDSDDILIAVEKINYNFDQLLLAGGGPAGAQGVQGIQGVAGSKGDRGSQWVAGQGTSTINLPTDFQFRENDFLLNDGGSFVGGPKGQVWYYNNLSTWVDTGINLMGPTGPIGPTGGEGITIIKGNYSTTTNAWQPDPTGLTNYISNLSTVLAGDSDDNKSGTFIDKGLDFAVLGRGNNSLVLGRYSTLFAQANITTPDLQTPGGNPYLSYFPGLTGGGDTPMLVIAQNDYKDPSANSSFSNGISIGLNRSHKQSTYDSEFTYFSDFNYEGHFANISIENRLLDFKIKGTEYGNVNIESSGAHLTLANNAVFATPSTTKRINIDSYSTILKSERYTRFDIKDSLLLDINTSSLVNINGAGLITRADFSYFESERKYTPQSTDLRGNTSRTYFTSNDATPSVNNANEITLINKSTLITNNSTDPEKKGRIENNYSILKPQIELNADRYEYPFKIGQTFINVPVINQSLLADVNLNIKYEGLGYDQNIISYSTDNNAIGGSGNTITTTGNSSYKGVIANNTDLDEFLYGSGKGITVPISGGNVSMSRMIYRPGFFRNGGKVNQVFDEAHKIMPTGSLDLYGTVRLREQGETDGGLKDGFIATNAKDGIVKWEPASSINAVPTGAVIMFSEMSADKFSFFGVSKRNYGYTGVGTNGTSYRPGGTGIGAVFIGKGSGDLKDYYICNGAILADSRDCWITGPFSKLQGIQTVDGSDETTVSNANDLLYEKNSEFKSRPGASVSFNDAHWYIYNLNIGTHQNARDFYLSILNQSSVASDGINAKYRKSWGYSIPGPSTLESGFRVVLPNYFGRFPKMVFPSGEFMTELFYTKGLSETYLDSNKKYNDKFAIRTSFDDLGSPYILKQNLPDTSHFHTIKDIKSEFDGYHQHTIDEVDGHTHSPGTLNITSSGSHRHGYQLHGRKTAEDLSGNVNEGFIRRAENFNLGSITSSNTENKISPESHTHSSNDFAGDTAIGGTHSHTMSTDGLHQHNISQHNTESKTVDNRGYNGTTYNVTDYYTRGNSSTFFANWKTSGQRFFDPPFKGTYFAINLKGLKNPLRANTTIQDLHYVGGIPSCGYSNDTSWFSDTSLQSTSWAQGWFGNNTKPYYNPGGSVFTPDSMDIRAFEYNFREMWRNDNTTHPYNYVVPSTDNRGELYSDDSTDSGTAPAFQNLAYVNHVYNRP